MNTYIIWSKLWILIFHRQKQRRVTHILLTLKAWISRIFDFSHLLELIILIRIQVWFLQNRLMRIVDRIIFFWRHVIEWIVELVFMLIILYILKLYFFKGRWLILIFNLTWLDNQSRSIMHLLLNLCFIFNLLIFQLFNLTYDFLPLFVSNCNPSFIVMIYFIQIM